MKTEKLTEDGLFREITVTREKLIEMHETVESFKANDLLRVSFTHALARNATLWEAEAKTTTESIQPQGRYIKYQQARFQLAKKHSIRDEKGKAVAIPAGSGQGVGYEVDPEKRKEFEAEEKSLKEEYKEVIEAFDLKLEEYPELLKENVTVRLYVIPISRFPKAASGQIMKALIPCIKESAELIEKYFEEQENAEEAEKTRLAKEKANAEKVPDSKVKRS